MNPKSISMGRGTGVGMVLAIALCSTSFARTHTPPSQPLLPLWADSDPVAAPRASFESVLSPDERWLAVRTLPQDKTASELAIVSVDDGVSRSLSELQTRAKPAWDEHGRLQVRVVDPELGVRQVRLIDPTTGATIETTRDRDTRSSSATSSSSAAGESAYPSWARVDERKGPDGRVIRRVEWPNHSARFDLPKTGELDCEISQTPGLVYYSLRTTSNVQVFRHAMQPEATDLLATLDGGLVAWSVSPDGHALLVVEPTLGRRARVIDVRNGMLLDGPWPASAAAWLDDGAQRYVRLDSSDGRRIVVDRMRDRQIEYGTVAQPWPSIRPLQDGRFVVETAQSVEVCNDKLEPIRRLFSLE